MDEREKWDHEMSMAVAELLVVGGMEVVLTTAPSGSSAWVSSAGAAARGSSAFGSVGGACSDSAFQFVLRVRGKRCNT